MTTATTLSPVHQTPTFAMARSFATWLWPLHVRLASLPEQSTVNDLRKDAFLWIERPLAREVHCLEGALWLTFDGEPVDHVLEAGQSLRCPHGSRLGIHALAASRVRVG